MTNNCENSQFDSVDHVALQVHDLDLAVNWYVSSFRCEVLMRTSTQAVLQFSNIKVVLVLPSQQQSHLAFNRLDAGSFGELHPHLEGQLATAVADPSGNIIELVVAEQPK
jgi:catechol 2,3-dioxygenase-like lactoylglutathione lyase family enzyme